MKLLIAGGGTGGHVYPALSIVEALTRSGSCRLDQVSWAGTRGSIEERLADQQGIGFCPIEAKALREKGLVQKIGGLARMCSGTLASRRLIADGRHDVVLATGGFASVPVVLGARLAGCPVLLYLPDITPGMAVRFLARLATRIAVSFDQVLAHFAPGKAMVTGYPVRHAFYAHDRDRAKELLGVDVSEKLILVLGGSQGARSINIAIGQHLAEYLERAVVYHIAGPTQRDACQRASEDLVAPLDERYHLYGYMHDELPMVMAAADLVIARAGAATLGELPAVGAASILVPYPFSGEHQMVNAEYLANRGAAIIVRDRQLPEELYPTACALLRDDARRADMQRAASELASPQAAQRLADALCDLSSDGREAEAA